MAPKENQSDCCAPVLAFEAVDDVFLDEDEDVHVEQTHLFEDPRGIDALNMDDLYSLAINVWQFFIRQNSPAPRRRTQSTPREIEWLSSAYTSEQRADSVIFNVYRNILNNDSGLAEFERDINRLFVQLTFP